LRRSYETLDRLLASEDKIIAGVRADMARIDERVDAEAKRYRELVSSGASRRARSPGFPPPRCLRSADRSVIAADPLSRFSGGDSTP